MRCSKWFGFKEKVEVIVYMVSGFCVYDLGFINNCYIIKIRICIKVIM